MAQKARIAFLRATSSSRVKVFVNVRFALLDEQARSPRLPVILVEPRSFRSCLSSGRPPLTPVSLPITSGSKRYLIDPVPNLARLFVLVAVTGQVIAYNVALREPFKSIR